MPQAARVLRHADPRVRAVVSLFEDLSPADLPDWRGEYAANTRLRD